MQDFVSLLRDLISLIRAHELEAAAQQVKWAASSYAAACHQARSEVITEINRALLETKRQREALREAVHGLPDRDRLFAEMQVEAVIDTILADERARLLTEKRRTAKPR